MNRRGALSILIGSTATVAMGGCLHGAREELSQPALAVTLDDFDISDTPLLSGAARHEAILTALRRHNIQAAGLVTGKKTLTVRVGISIWRNGQTRDTPSATTPTLTHIFPGRMWKRS